MCDCDCVNVCLLFLSSVCVCCLLGHAGVRNVKWLRQVTLAAEESKGPWQRGIAYKGFGPSVKSVEGESVSTQQSAVSTQRVTVCICICMSEYMRE